MKTAIKCACCSFVVQLQEAVFSDGLQYCSFDCVAFEQDEEREAFDSYFADAEDHSGEYASLYK